VTSLRSLTIITHTMSGIVSVFSLTRVMVCTLFSEEFNTAQVPKNKAGSTYGVGQSLIFRIVDKYLVFSIQLFAITAK